MALDTSLELLHSQAWVPLLQRTFHRRTRIDLAKHYHRLRNCLGPLIGTLIAAIKVGILDDKLMAVKKPGLKVTK